MIKIENGRCEIKGNSEDIFIDMFGFTIALVEHEELQDILECAQEAVKEQIKEGKYVPHNTSYKSGT